MHIGQRIKALMKAKGVTNKQVATYCGVTEGAVPNWFSSGRISKENLVKVAELLGVTTEEIITGEPGRATAHITMPGFSVASSASNQAPALIVRAVSATYLIDDVYPAEFSIPLLSWVRAGEFCEAPGQFTRENAEELLPRPLFRTGPSTFALRVVGDSMDVPDGYREGEIVYIDPDVEPTPGKDVLAKYDERTTLKRYKIDEEGPYLLQLNGNKIIRPSDWSVCGVVVFSGKKR